MKKQSFGEINHHLELTHEEIESIVREYLYNEGNAIPREVKVSQLVFDWPDSYSASPLTIRWTERAEPNEEEWNII